MMNDDTNTEDVYSVEATALNCGFWVIGTARIVCGTASMKRYCVRPFVCTSVRLSVPAWVHSSKPAAAGCYCGPGGQDISTNCCSSGMRRANAGSATLLACVVAEHRLVSTCPDAKLKKNHTCLKVTQAQLVTIPLCCSPLTCLVALRVGLHNDVSTI